jgi:PilZ domain
MFAGNRIPQIIPLAELGDPRLFPEVVSMQAGPLTTLRPRARQRHELRSLTYVTLDQANGGIVRNLTHDGIAVQAVAAVRPRQQVRVRFELRYPRLRVDARGEVVWSTFSAKCGIRFIDLPPRLMRQIDEWIFGDLLEGGGLNWAHSGTVTIGPATTATIAARAAPPTVTEPTPAPATQVLEQGEENGLIVSPAEVKVIEMPAASVAPAELSAEESSAGVQDPGDLDWLSQPLSGRGLARTVDSLIVIAALLLFAVVFLLITREAPRWPLTLGSGAAILVYSLYWGFFKIFGGPSFGERLARLAGTDLEAHEEAANARFR